MLLVRYHKAQAEPYHGNRCPVCVTAHANAKASPRDLWGLAAAKLKDKDKCHVLHLTTDLESLRAAVEERKRECVEKQWFVNSRLSSQTSQTDS